MFDYSPVGTPAEQPAVVWLVTALMTVGAVIDGWKLKVPNWLTFPMVFTGWAYSAAAFGWEGLGWSLAGTLTGFMLLFPAYAIGGMGAGDVKLLAGTGAWVWSTLTFHGFLIGVIVGGVMAVGMVLWKGGWQRHRDMFLGIMTEIVTIRDAEKLATIAAERKSSMLLLPYGVPITIGTVGYFLWAGLLV